jgi:hypothetical protein
VQATELVLQLAAQNDLEMISTRADIDADRPATLSAGAGFTGDRERAGVAFDRWNEALAQRATILRTFLRGDGSGLFQVTHTDDISEFNGDWGTHPLTP